MAVMRPPPCLCKPCSHPHIRVRRVRVGVLCYVHGGASAVGIPGLVRLLPAAVVPPFAASLGDRFRRERFLLAMTFVGSVALAGSAAASYAGSELLVFAFAALVGLASTLIRPTLQGP